MRSKARCIWNILRGRPTLYRVTLPWDADPSYPALYDAAFDLSNCNEHLTACYLTFEQPAQPKDAG